MNPEDVGGTPILENIKSEIMGILGKALQLPMSEMCYCKSPLYRCRFKRSFNEVNDWRCSSCFAIQCGRAAYKCIAGDCSFKRISSSMYRVCPSCFECPSEHDSSYETEEKEDAVEATYIYRQINRQIAVISSEFPYVCVRQPVIPRLGI